jgi:peptidoglycan/LPS O-acetylase OafA/YrhL
MQRAACQYDLYPDALYGYGISKLVVQTTAPQQETASNPISGRGWPLLAGVLMLFAPRRLRRRGRWLAEILLSAALAAGALNGCGGSSSLTGGTPAGTYPITVTGAATFGTLVVTETTMVTVTVKSMF